MPTRRVLKSVAQCFLGKYTSRSSEYEGYWLFGFLTGDLAVDLLAPVEPFTSPESVAIGLAAVGFAEQLRKSGLDPSVVRAAELSIERRPEVVEGVVNGQWRGGHRTRFRVVVTADTGRRFEHACWVFVAPHDPGVEHRSGRCGTVSR